MPIENSKSPVPYCNTLKCNFRRGIASLRYCNALVHKTTCKMEIASHPCYTAISHNILSCTIKNVSSILHSNTTSYILQTANAFRRFRIAVKTCNNLHNATEILHSCTVVPHNTVDTPQVASYRCCIALSCDITCTVQIESNLCCSAVH